jgi:programmed cell death protein 5
MAGDGDAELADLRRRRLQQLQQMQAAQNPEAMNAAYAQQQAEQSRRDSERSEALRRILTPEARERLGRIRLAKPDVAQAVEQQVLSLAASGRLQRAIDDTTLRAILERVMPERRDITITRR